MPPLIRVLFDQRKPEDTQFWELPKLSHDEKELISLMKVAIRENHLFELVSREPLRRVTLSYGKTNCSTISDIPSAEESDGERSGRIFEFNPDESAGTESPSQDAVWIAVGLITLLEKIKGTGGYIFGWMGEPYDDGH